MDAPDRYRQSRRWLAIGTALQLLVAVPLLVATDDGDGRPTAELRVATAPPSDEPATTTTIPTEVLGVVHEPTTTTAPPTTLPPPAPVPTTTLACRNSTDSRCGPFRWDPDPGPNAPLTVEVRVEPANPRAGEEVRFFVTARDADASYFWGVCSDYGDEAPTCIDGVRLDPNDPSSAYCGSEKHGPWTPPPRRAGETTLGYPQGSGVTHVYAEPGTYTARFPFRSDSVVCGLHEPYGSTGEGVATVVVGAAQGSAQQQGAQ